MMKTTTRTDETISKWLEEAAPARLPERVLDATFERTRRTRQHGSWHTLLPRLRLAQFGPALVGAATFVVVAALALGLYVNRPGLGGAPSSAPSTTPSVAPSPSDEPTPTPSPTVAPTPTPSPTPEPRAPFLGVWVSTSDADTGTQTMTVSATAADDSVAIVVLDDIASVCSGTPSTMTGAGRIAGRELVIPTPDYTCDDGSEPRLLNGNPTPINEVLRNLTYVYDPESDTLSIGDGLWVRESAFISHFYGTWISTSDSDGGTQRMTVNAVAEGGVTIVVTDDMASVCSGAPSTMTGAGRIAGRELVIPTPDYTCDDGSEPRLLDGDPTPLNDFLRNLTYVYDPESDTLSIGDGLWVREEGQ